MRGHFLFQTVGLLFSSALSFERFCDGPAFKLAAAAFVGRRSALQAYALSQPVKKPLMGVASMAPIRRLEVRAISSICAGLLKFEIRGRELFLTFLPTSVACPACTHIELMSHTPKRRIRAIEAKPKSGFSTGCERAYACNALLLPTKAAAASLEAHQFDVCGEVFKSQGGGVVNLRPHQRSFISIDG